MQIETVVLMLAIFAVYATLVAAALVQISRATNLGSTARAVWVLIVIIAPLLGSIAWFAIGRASAPDQPTIRS